MPGNSGSVIVRLEPDLENGVAGHLPDHNRLSPGQVICLAGCHEAVNGSRKCMDAAKRRLGKGGEPYLRPVVVPPYLVTEHTDRRNFLSERSGSVLVIATNCCLLKGRGVKLYKRVFAAQLS